MSPNVLLVLFGLCVLGIFCCCMGSSCGSISANGYKPKEEESMTNTAKGLFSAFSSISMGLCIQICVTIAFTTYLKITAKV